MMIDKFKVIHLIIEALLDVVKKLLLNSDVSKRAKTSASLILALSILAMSERLALSPLFETRTN